MLACRLRPACTYAHVPRTEGPGPGPGPPGGSQASPRTEGRQGPWWIHATSNRVPHRVLQRVAARGAPLPQAARTGAREEQGAARETVHAKAISFPLQSGADSGQRNMGGRRRGRSLTCFGRQEGEPTTKEQVNRTRGKGAGGQRGPSLDQRQVPSSCYRPAPCVPCSRQRPLMVLRVTQRLWPRWRTRGDCRRHRKTPSSVHPLNTTLFSPSDPSSQEPVVLPSPALTRTC